MSQLLKRAWSQRNTPFALWVMSSVVLALLTGAFTQLQSGAAERSRKAEQVRRLDTEIGSRISSALAGLRADKMRIEQQGERYQQDSLYINTQSYLDNFFLTDPSIRRDFSVYPEFQKRTFRSLVFELRTLVDPSMQGDLTDALKSYEELLDRGSVATKKGTASRKESLEAVANAAEFVESRLVKPRWRSLM